MELLEIKLYKMENTENWWCHDCYEYYKIRLLELEKV